MSEVGLRTVAGVIMILVALTAEWFGGTAFAIFVAAIATMMYYEWSKLVRGWGLGWHAAGFFMRCFPPWRCCGSANGRTCRAAMTTASAWCCGHSS